MSVAAVAAILDGSGPPSPVVGSFPASIRDGAFRDVQGRIWKYRGVTAFKALTLALAGDWDALEDYAAWTRSIGGNTWRAFGMWGNAGLSPLWEPRYYEAFDELLAWMARRGLTLHYVAFTDQVEESAVWICAKINGSWQHDVDAQDEHARQVIDVVSRHANCLVEWVNEDFKNGDLSRRYDHADQRLTTRSSWPDGADPVYASQLILDWSTHHTPRGDQSVRKFKELVDIARLGVTGLPATNKPAVGGEPPRLSEWSPRQAAAYFAGAEMFGAGACLHGGFHSLDPGTGDDDLQACVAPLPGTHAHNVGLAVRDVWAAGIPPQAAGEWSYTRGPFGNCPLVHHDEWALRTFAMLGGDRAVAVVVDPNEDWQQIAQDGWRVTKRVGDVFLFER